MPTLTSLLARDAIVSLDVVEQALQRQVLEGGEIDTALLELAAVPENVLAAYRAASFDLAPAARAQLERIDTALIARVPPKLAREFRVVPFALERDVLVLAVDAPLQAAESQRLVSALGTRVSFRVVTELRSAAALHQHYGVELPERLRLLEQRLRGVSPGELCEVRQSTPSREPIAFRNRVSARPPDSGLRVPREGGIADAVRRVSASMPPPPARSPSSVAMASVLASPDRHEEAVAGPKSATKAPSVQRVPRGPFTWQQAVEALNEAGERDRVLDIFFSFARQYFDCSVLLIVRDERLYPFRSAGLSAAADDEGISLRLLSGGSVFAATQTLSARVADLRGHSSDAALLGAIGRARFQPCALVPISIRKRMIGLLYGDRGGEALELGEFSDVLPLVSNVGVALERIIQERKRSAAEGRSEVVPTDSAPGAPKVVRTTSLAPPPAPLPAGHAVARRTTTAAPPGLPRVPSAPDLALQPTVQLPAESGGSATAALRAAVPTVPPMAPRVSSPASQVSIPHAHAPQSPVRTVPAPGPVRVVPPPAHAEDSPPIQPVAPTPATRAQPQPSAPRPGSYSERGGEEHLGSERRDATKTVPQRPSRLSETSRSSIARISLAPPPRTLAHAPAGSGSYSLRPQPASIDLDPTDRPPPMPAPSKVDVAASSTTAPGGEPTIVVAPPSAEAERLVEELAACTPEEGQSQIDALLRLGDDGLRALQRRFPGPLWFDRHKPRHRIPSGHDISAVARGVRAFEDKALPVLAELMGGAQVDSRLCALLLAAERPRSALIWPLYQRLFDADGQVRVMALEVLPRFRTLPEFAELLRLLRERAGDEREPIPSRLSALEAIGALRDSASIELLLRLCKHGSRQLSVPAHRSLLLITAQDFGDSERKWKAWLDKNRQRPRVEWLIESLMHSDERVRNTAGLELQKLTQVYYGFVASSPKRDRERAQQRYRDWLRQQGKVPTLA